MTKIHDISAERIKRDVEQKQRINANADSILLTLKRMQQLPIPKRDVYFIDLLIKNATEAQTSANNSGGNFDFDLGRIEVVVKITEELVKQYEDLFS